jgi:hypothetical protein
MCTCSNGFQIKLELSQLEQWISKTLQIPEIKYACSSHVVCVVRVVCVVCVACVVCVVCSDCTKMV